MESEAEKIFELKSISEILESQFFIPHYQRGYRWTKQQVEDLLNDIDAFNPKEIPGIPDEKTFYCLQPVVLKKCNDEIKLQNELKGNWYEVIDGQQRLTTIYLIIHYANEMWTGKKKTPEIALSYETREESVEVLKNIKVETDNTVFINKKYIDYYHITSAYSTIHEWVQNYQIIKDKPFDEDDFKKKFKTNAKIIWYEVSQSENS